MWYVEECKNDRDILQLYLPNSYSSLRITDCSVSHWQHITCLHPMSTTGQTTLNDGHTCTDESSISMQLHPWKAIDSLRQQSVLCDCTIVLPLRNERFDVHAVVLAACSLFFRKLITHEREALQNPAHSRFSPPMQDAPNKHSPRLEIVLPGVDTYLVERIIEYAYANHVEDLNFDMVQALLPLADQWGIAGLVELCASFLASNMELENCIGIWYFAQHYQCRQLANLARQYVLWKIWDCVHTSLEYLQMDAESLISLMHDDNLNLPREQDIWHCIALWVDQCDNRKHHLPALIPAIRLGLMTVEARQELTSAPLLQEEPGRSAWSRELTAFVFEDLHYKTPIIAVPRLASPKLRPRVPHDIMFAIGGWAGTPLNEVETYDSKANRWFLNVSATEPNFRAYHGIAELSGLLYVVGGFDGNEYFNSVRTFCPRSRQWREAAPMYHARCYVATCVLDGQMYAVGGYDGHQRLNTVERYNPTVNQWTLVQSMRRRRSDACVSTANGRMYVAGGFTGLEVLDSVECYNPATNTWFYIANMLSPRSGVSMTSIGDTLYAIGGYDGARRLRSCEMYRQETRRWQAITEMITPRSNLAVAILDGFIYAVGGFNGTAPVSTVERYDPKSNQWESATPMIVARSALKVCVVPALSNAKEYSLHGAISNDTSKL